MTRIVVRRLDRGPDCSLCRDSVGDVAVACPGCDARYHDDCLAELATRCATIGCDALQVLTAPAFKRIPEPPPFNPAMFLAFFAVVLGAPMVMCGYALFGAKFLMVVGHFAGVALGPVIILWAVGNALLVFMKAITPPPRASKQRSSPS
jgi:hypothetical protein